MFDRPGSNEGDTPGPVVAADQIMLNHVVLAYNGADFGNEDESVPSANVGDTIAAAAYYLDGYTPTDLYRGDKVDFSWQVASSADGAFAEVATGDTYTVEDKHAGKYLQMCIRDRHWAWASGLLAGAAAAKRPAAGTAAAGHAASAKGTRR